MNQLYLRVFFFCLAMLLTSCATQKIASDEPIEVYPIAERQQYLANLSDWQITGKIAFITPEEKQSAAINWHHKSSNQQEINLTSYLGINVFKLKSNAGLHKIEVDGETYQSHNLDQLIYQLTGLTFPSEALTYWLKALAYNQADNIIYGSDGLPKQINSSYQQKMWQINYTKYQHVANHMLPTHLTIVRGNLKIKLQLKQWDLS